MPDLLEEENPEDRPERPDDPRLRNRTCPDCGEGPFTLSELGNHSKTCPEAMKRREKEKALKASLEEELTPEPEKEEESLYVLEQDPGGILRQILEKHPGIKESVLNEVMEWAELYGVLQPTQLPYILTSLGVKHSTASLITQKYTLAMQKSSQNAMPYGMSGMIPPVFSSPGQQAPNMMFPYMPQQQQPVQQQPIVMTPLGPMYGPTPRQRNAADEDSMERKFATKADLQQMMEDMRKRSEMDELKDEIKTLREAVSRAGRGPEAGAPGVIGYEEERVPIDKDGNIVHPNQAVSVRYVRRPVHGGTYAAAADTAVMQKLNDLEKRFTDDKFTSLEKQLEDLKKPKAEDPAVTELKNQLSGYASKIDELSEELDEREKAELRGMISDMRSQLQNISIGEYKEDTMRIIGNSLNKVAEVLDKRTPLQTLGDIFFPQARIEPHDQEIVVPPGGGNRFVQERLAQHGLTTTIQQQA